MSAMGADPVGFPHHHMNGGQRKYQCKMCPQVGESFFNVFKIITGPEMYTDIEAMKRSKSKVLYSSIKLDLDL